MSRPMAMRKLSQLVVLITMVAAASGCTNSARTHTHPKAHAPGQAVAAGPTPCPATPAKSLPRSNRWRRNGWLSPVNKALSQRIFNDREYLARHGVELTEWGPDARTGKTKIYLTHYTPAAARVLYARYGCAIVVATTSEPRPSPAWLGTRKIKG